MKSSITQNSKILDVTYIIPMEADEARQCADGIRTRLYDVAVKLNEMHERQGWKALGYTSWEVCTEAEFHFTRQRAHQLMEYGLVKQNIERLPAQTSTTVDVLPGINERQARELAKVEPEHQREVYAEAVKATNGKPTASAVAEQVNAYRGFTRSVPKPGAGGKRSSNGRGDAKTRCKALLDACSDTLAEEAYEWLSERIGVSS